MKPLAIMIMDGFGISLEEKGNAVAKANKPTWINSGRIMPPQP